MWGDLARSKETPSPVGPSTVITTPMRQLLPVSRSEGSQNNIGGVDGLLLDGLWLKEFEFFLPTIRFSKGPENGMEKGLVKTTKTHTTKRR